MRFRDLAPMLLVPVTKAAWDSILLIGVFLRETEPRQGLELVQVRGLQARLPTQGIQA